MSASEGYRIIRPLGSSPAGTVYLAETSRGLIAIRQFASPHEPDSPFWQADRERFLQAGRQAQTLDHPRILPVLEVIDEAGAAFVASEYVEGETLQSAMASRRFSFEEATAILGQIALALDFAHDRGVVHGDLKPSEIFLVAQGPRVADFGISPLAHWDPRQPMPPYLYHEFLSPEHLRDPASVDGRSDQYSLAVIAYWLFTGQSPYGQFGGDLAAAISTVAPAPPSTLNPQLPPSFDSPMLRALDRDPARRFESCRKFIGALGAGMIPQPVAVGPRWLKTGAWVAAGLVPLLALAGYFAFRSRPTQPAQPRVKWVTASDLTRSAAQRNAASTNNPAPTPGAAPFSGLVGGAPGGSGQSSAPKTQANVAGNPSGSPMRLNKPNPVAGNTAPAPAGYGQSPAPKTQPNTVAKPNPVPGNLASTPGGYGQSPAPRTQPNAAGKPNPAAGNTIPAPGGYGQSPAPKTQSNAAAKPSPAAGNTTANSRREPSGSTSYPGSPGGAAGGNSQPPPPKTQASAAGNPSPATGGPSGFSQPPVPAADEPVAGNPAKQPARRDNPSGAAGNIATLKPPTEIAGRDSMAGPAGPAAGTKVVKQSVIAPKTPGSASYDIQVFSRDNPLREGQQFALLDPRFGEMAFGDLKAMVSGDTPLRAGSRFSLEWSVGGLRHDSCGTPRDSCTVRLNELVVYRNQPAPGVYEVKLTLDGRWIRSFSFTITP